MKSRKKVQISPVLLVFNQFKSSGKNTEFFIFQDEDEKKKKDKK